MRKVEAIGLHVQLKTDRFIKFLLQAQIIQFHEISFPSALAEGADLMTKSDRIHRFLAFRRAVEHNSGGQRE